MGQGQPRRHSTSAQHLSRTPSRALRQPTEASPSELRAWSVRAYRPIHVIDSGTPELGVLGC